MEAKNKIITIKHTVNSGDLIANLASIKHVCESMGRKALIYQQLDMEAIYYPGATHPVTDDKGKMVTMNKKQFDLLQPLVLVQPYVAGFAPFEGQEVMVDLGKMRGEMNINMPYMDIRLWPSLIWPDMCPDISQPWLEGANVILGIGRGIKINYDKTVTEETPTGPHTILAGSSVTKYGIPIEDKVIINFTDRYRNSNIHYYWLKEYQDHIVFAGTAGEHKSFCDKWKLDIPYLVVDNFLHLAEAIRHCRFFMGNQSMCWGIADAMKVTPRILEYCTWVPNCTWGIGPDSYAYLYQHNAEFYFKKLFNQTK